MTTDPTPTDAEPEPEPSRRRAWPRAARVLAALLAAGAAVQPAAMVLGRYDWRAEIFCHFPLAGLGLTLAALAATAARRQFRVALALAALAGLQASMLLRYAGPNPVPPDPRATGRVRLLMANLLLDNGNHEAVARLIRDERPDIVGLVEYTFGWREGLAVVREAYPYRVEAPSYGSSGLALWFREPPLETDPPELPGEDGWPYLHAEFSFAGRPRHLWLLHPKPPQLRRGGPELAALAGRIGAIGGSRIVMGDVNSSEGSPLFRDFVRATGLRDTRFGFGRQPSWPSNFPLPLRIPIDHALISDDLAVADRRLGPEVGSDHFPLILDLAPAAARSDSTSATSQAD